MWGRCDSVAWPLTYDAEDCLVRWSRRAGIDGQVKSPMKLLATTTLTTWDGSIATMDDIETTIRVLDESFRVSLILGGVFAGLLAVLVFSLYVALLVTELRKSRG